MMNPSGLKDLREEHVNESYWKIEIKLLDVKCTVLVV